MSKLINENKDRVVKIKEALKGLSYKDSFQLLYEMEKELTTDVLSKTTF